MLMEGLQTPFTINDLAFKDGFLPIIFNGASDAILFIQVEENAYRFIMANKAFFDETGFTKEQVIGQLVDTILPPEVYTNLLRRYEEAVLTKAPVTYESETVLPGGKHIFEITITPIFDTDQVCRYLVGVSRDITHRDCDCDE
jgi:PAS domain S-box-containing protein